MRHTPVLHIDNLSIQFGPHFAVKQASLTLERGEMLALVGESGSGKSLTALSVLRLLPAHAQLQGCIQFCGEDLLSADEKRLRAIRGRRIGMIFQEPMTSLNPLHTIAKQIGEVLVLHQGMNKQAVRARIVELLQLVGIDDAEQRLLAYPHELSGGQRQRVMIAMALANEPELLIADEPTTALDVNLQAQILELLQDLKQRLGLSILLISHDLNLVRRHADKVVVMQAGTTVEAATTTQLFSAAQHDYTRHLLAATPSGAPMPLPADSRTILEVPQLDVHFALKKSLFGRVLKSRHALQNMTLTLKAGETLGVVGESGSGKSTLALALLRLLPAQGRVVFLGQELMTLSQQALRPLRSRMQMVFQDPYGSLSPRLCIADIVGEGLEAQGMSAAARRQAVCAALKAVQLDDPHILQRYPHEFSGGQRQRIAIARALVLKPALLVLDEPTSALDRTVQKQIVDLLRDLQGEYGFACLFISHDLSVVKALCHRIMVMRQGQLVECQDTAQLFAEPQTAYTRELLAAAGFALPAAATHSADPQAPALA